MCPEPKSLPVRKGHLSDVKERWLNTGLTLQTNHVVSKALLEEAIVRNDLDQQAGRRFRVMLNNRAHLTSKAKRRSGNARNALEEIKSLLIAAA